MTNLIARPMRVLRKRLKIAFRIAPYLGGKSSSRILVDELYLSILDEPGDPVARAAEAKALSRGTSTVLQIVRRLRAMSEPRTVAPLDLIRSDVEEIYRGLIDRSPTEQELARISSSLRSGVALSRIIKQVASSGEARQACFRHALNDGGISDLLLVEVNRRRGR